MSLIRAVENIVGSIENWPTHILEHLFCEIPDLEALEGLIAFFYGKGIPCPMACQFFHACNSKATANVTEQFYAIYSFWESCTYEVHLAQYFNMTLKKYVYINGSYKDPCELVHLQLPVKIGIDNTPFPTVIRFLLNGICTSVDYY